MRGGIAERIEARRNGVFKSLQLQSPKAYELILQASDIYQRYAGCRSSSTRR
jgi:hypothetical protein